VDKRRSGDGADGLAADDCLDTDSLVGANDFVGTALPGEYLPASSSLEAPTLVPTFGCLDTDSLVGANDFVGTALPGEYLLASSSLDTPHLRPTFGCLPELTVRDCRPLRLGITSDAVDSSLSSDVQSVHEEVWLSE
jgi:hypothetical protein